MKRKVKIDRLGRVVIPKEYRDALELKAKSRLQVNLIKNTIVLTPLQESDDYGLAQIDEVGRVVIPAPYRYTLKLKAQQNLFATLVADSVIFTVKENETDNQLTTYPLICSIESKLQALAPQELLHCLDLIEQLAPKTA